MWPWSRKPLGSGSTAMLTDPAWAPATVLTRAIQGDSVGALRLLLPAPDGVASQSESRDPGVLRLGAQIARLAGKGELALELAAKNPDPVERELLRASVLSGRPQMAQEANAALISALELSADRTGRSAFRPLLALSRRFNSLDATEQETVTAHIAAVERRDPDLAEVLRARVDLSQGNTQEALTRVRGPARSELVMETHADALVASGRAEEAARLVFDEGSRRGDIPLVTEALEIAMGGGQLSYAREIALHLLADEHGRPVHLKALRAFQIIAHEEQQWHEVVARTEHVRRIFETVICRRRKSNIGESPRRCTFKTSSNVHLGSSWRRPR